MPGTANLDGRGHFAAAWLTAGAVFASVLSSFPAGAESSHALGILLAAICAPALAIHTGGRARLDRSVRRLRDLTSHTLLPFVTIEVLATLIDRAESSTDGRWQPHGWTWVLVALFIWESLWPRWRASRLAMPGIGALAAAALMWRVRVGTPEVAAILLYWPWFALGYEVDLRARWASASRQFRVAMLALGLVGGTALLALLEHAPALTSSPLVLAFGGALSALLVAVAPVWPPFLRPLGVRAYHALFLHGLVTAPAAPALALAHVALGSKLTLLFSGVVAVALTLVLMSHGVDLYVRWFADWAYWLAGVERTSPARVPRSFRSARVRLRSFLHPVVRACRVVSRPLGRALLVTLVLAVSFFASEAVYRRGIDASWAWVAGHRGAAVASVVVLVTGYLGLRIWVRAAAATAILVGPVLLLGTASRVKTVYLGEPVYPWDLLLWRQLASVLGFLLHGWAIFAAVAIAMIGTAIVGHLTWRRTHRARFGGSWRRRILLALLAYGGASVLYRSYGAKILGLGIDHGVFHPPGRSEQVLSARDSYLANGHILAFLYNLHLSSVTPPQSYSRRVVEAALEPFLVRSEDKRQPITPTMHQPHVVAILSEAFWDPSRLPGVHFPAGSPGDLKTIQAGKRVQGTSGDVVVPVLGGLTCNTEFELLTGIPMRFLPDGAVPYVQYVRAPLQGLATRFRDSGYHTVAIHPYFDWFWNRREVLPRLGFDEFISLDAFAGAAKAMYVADDAVVDKIVSALGSASLPQFIFAITMANHGPWDDDRFATFSSPTIVWPTDRVLSPESQRRLTTYSIGVRESRQSLERLLAWLDRPEAPPTVVLFFGDHLPILGNSFATYVETGFLPSDSFHDWDAATSRRAYSTPYWLGGNVVGQQAAVPSTISMYAFGAELLTQAGIPLDPFQQVIKEHAKRFPIFSPAVAVDAAGNIIEDDDTYADPASHALHLLSYDRLFGESFARQRLSNALSADSTAQ